MIEFFILLGLIVVNGIFAMSELAIVSARTARLQSKADRGDVGAKTVIGLQDDPSRFLSTVQIGITLVGIVAGAYGATAIADELSPVIAKHVPAIEAEAGEIAFGLVIVFTTFLSLVIGELVPKRIAGLSGRLAVARFDRRAAQPVGAGRDPAGAGDGGRNPRHSRRRRDQRGYRP